MNTLRQRVPFFMNYASGYLDTVTGTDIITLPKAKLNSLKYVKLFGGTEQRNLPSGHQQLDYLQGDGAAYIETDVVPTNNTGMKIVFEYATSGPAAPSGTYDGDLPRQDTFFISTNSGSIGSSVAFIAHRGATLYADSIYTEIPVQGKTYTININYKNSGTMGIEGFTQINVGTDDVLSNKALLFARLNYNNDNITASSCKIKYVEFTEGTEVIRKYYPDRYNNALGLYDTVTNTFLTNKNSTGTFTAGADVTPSPDNVMPIWCNNGVIKVSPNLFTRAGETLDKFYNASGVEQSGVYSDYSFSHTDFIKVKPNTTYTLGLKTSYATGSGQLNHRVIGWTSSKSYVKEELNVIEPANTDVGTLLYDTFTTSATTEYVTINFVYTPLETEIQLVQGSTLPATYRPNGIYTDGTTETVEVTGKNLFDKNSITVGYYYNAQLEYTEIQDASLPDFIPVVTGEDYTISGYKDTTGSFNIRVNYFNANKEIQSQVVQQVPQGDYSFTITIPNGISYLRYSFRTGTQDSQQVELGSTATTYEQYFDGGTATAEMLLKVGTYKDEQSVIDGGVTRNVGIKVLDGTENWTTTSETNVFRVNIPHPANINFLCNSYISVDASIYAIDTMPNYSIKSHISLEDFTYIRNNNYSTVDSFKQYLADQYANGTPVIIVYPLATATTETVTAQPLSIKSGTNIIEITQASLNGLELEARYKRSK